MRRRITPARVCAAIRTSFPGVVEQHMGNLGADSAPRLGGIVALAKEIPDELLPSDPDAYALFVGSLGAIEGALAMWAGGSGVHATPLYEVPAVGGSPVRALYRVLAACPEEAPRADTTGLEFVSDVLVRESLRLDLSRARNALDRGDAKSTTVLSGAVIEALLVDALSTTTPDERDQALKVWRGRNKREGEKKASAELHASLDHWTLYELIWISRCMDIIPEAAAAVADCARDFRNLIHPGRLRLQVGADAGTAHAAYGAALRVIAELEKRSKT